MSYKVTELKFYLATRVSNYEQKLQTEVPTWLTQLCVFTQAERMQMVPTLTGPCVTAFNKDAALMVEYSGVCSVFDRKKLKDFLSGFVEYKDTKKSLYFYTYAMDGVSVVDDKVECSIMSFADAINGQRNELQVNMSLILFTEPSFMQRT